MFLEEEVKALSLSEKLKTFHDYNKFRKKMKSRKRKLLLFMEKKNGDRMYVKLRFEKQSVSVFHSWFTLPFEDFNNKDLFDLIKIHTANMIFYNLSSAKSFLLDDSESSLLIPQKQSVVSKTRPMENESTFLFEESSYLNQDSKVDLNQSIVLPFKKSA